MEDQQLNLFPELENEWEKEWHDMPEFISVDNRPVKQLVISFKTWADYKEFGKLIKQPLTKDTKSTWWPEMDYEKPSNYCYVDEK